MSHEERDQFVGSKRCVECHEDLRDQLQTRHARTLAPTTDPAHFRHFRSAIEYFDRIANVSYKTGVKSGVPIITATMDGYKTQAPADYAFGSGAVGTTYVSTRHNPPLEMRLSNYHNVSEWNITPGQQNSTFRSSPLGRALDFETQAECFVCHSTALVAENGKLDLTRSLFGVGCETCHGPGKAHVEAAKAGKGSDGMLALKPLRSEVSLQLCGKCHRSPNTVDLANPNHRSQLPRWQSAALSLSGCFKKGQVSCASCHDPHADADHSTEKQYDTICMSCHQPSHPEQKPCSLAMTVDCVACHMPRQEFGMPSNPRFRNHWIKVWD